MMETLWLSASGTSVPCFKKQKKRRFRYDTIVTHMRYALTRKRWEVGPKLAPVNYG